MPSRAIRDHVVRLGTAAAALLLSAVAVSGQERVVLQGQVVDASSAEPLSGAQVMAPLSERSALTDSVGRFEISFIRDHRYELVVGAVAYNPVRVTLGPAAEQSALVVSLEADPQALAALGVLQDRLEERRRLRRDRRLQLVEHGELAQMEESSAYDLVRRLTVANPCSNQRDLCRLGRSRVRLCIDDANPGAGARELESYDVSDLWLIEVYANGRSVRVYSRWFIDQTVRARDGEIRLRPIC